MSSRRAWCQSRLNSSCSRASSSVRLNISLRRWTPRTVCTARLGRPLSTQYMGAKRSSSIRGSASFRKTSAQLLSRRLAFFGVTRNWDCQRLSCGSRIRNILPSLGQAQRPRPFITLSPPCPRMARGFYEQIKLEFAEFLTVSPSSMSEQNPQALREVGWSDEDIVDIVHITALYNYLVRVADGLGIEIEPGKQATSERLVFKDEVSSKRYGKIAPVPSD